MWLKVPYYQLFNEQSVVWCPLRADFVAKMRELRSVLEELCKYGYGLQMCYSVGVYGRTCFSRMTFIDWLKSSSEDPEERMLLDFYRGVFINKGLRTEEVMQQGCEGVDYDLSWCGKRLYQNVEQSVPAFLISSVYDVPSIALKGTDGFHASTASVQIEYVDENYQLRQKECNVVVFSELSHIAEHVDFLENQLNVSVLTGAELLDVSLNILPHFSYSKEALEDLKCMSLSTMPILRPFLRMEEAFVRCVLDRRRDFFEEYGNDHMIARDESESTKNLYGNERVFHWMDGARTCYSHLRLNKKRVHFLVSFDAKKIFIGHIGRHLHIAAER